MNTATATLKQIAFIHSLMGSHDLTEANRESVQNALVREPSKREASQIIDWLKTLPRTSVALDSTEVETEAADLEGMHRVNGTIFKVQRAIHGSGNLYAKALLEDGNGGWAFEYAPGAIRNLSEDTKMTLDEAKEWGALYGTCCVCGRTLTDEASIEAGIGPVCAKRF